MNRAGFTLIAALWAGIWSPLFAAEISDAELEFFEKKVRPVLVGRCYDCHSAESKIKGGLRLDSRKGVQAGGDSGVVIIAGKPDQSPLIEAVRYHNRDLQMPPKNRLPAEEIEILERWVMSGAPDPRIEKSGAPEKVTGLSLEEGRTFWSFQPLANPKIPEVKLNERVKNPIDAFILSELEKKKITPAPPTDKRTLIRRVTQNLIGLPPTPKEIENFLADDSPDAYEKVIERLLASPHYGIRWGRHWLDVARYADSNGLDENLGFGQAWRYRDYVVNSFNADKPFDQFLMEQIAGDLVPGANEETRTGTGFLSLGAKVLAEPDLKKLDMDIIDEQLDTMGKVFLGMTFGCVRCHDHKFDPVTQTDYYALAAIFKGTKSLSGTKTGAIKHWFEHSFADEEEKKRIKEVNKQVAAEKKKASSFKSAEITKIRTTARSKAVDYLVAATQIKITTPLTEITAVAKPHDLHPRILHHCRMHLEFHRDDPFFKDWHRFASRGEVDQIRAHYGSLFVEAEEALAAARRKKPKTKTLTDPRLEAARSALYHNAGFLAVPTVDAYAFDEKTLEKYHGLLSAARAFEIQAPDESAAMGVGDAEKPVLELAVHIRGSHHNLGDPVSREFPAVMRISKVRPVFPANGSGRLQLARWMADSRHPLTARVIVNRIWGWHFGRGLVGTTENFGVKGDRPSHPELLDWLARYFMENGWSIKELHRLILKSNTYRQDSVHPKAETFSLVDAENHLLWRANLQRLEAEQIRDSILAVSGRLDPGIGGKTLPLRNRQFVFNHTSEDHTKYDSLRRAIYLPVIRNNIYSLFEQFDYPDPTMPTGSRSSTVIAPQALVMLNYDLVMDSAEAMAEMLIEKYPDPSDRISEAYLLSLGRKPTTRETERVQRFLEETLSRNLTDSASIAPGEEFRVLALFCQGLMAGNEFLYIR